MSESNGTRGQTPEDVRRVGPRPTFAAGDAVPGLSSWVLERRLGGGGFGEVWLARHAWEKEQRPRAVKFCTAPEARQRLVTHERNVVLRVMKYAGKHPNVVPLLECNLDGETPWLMYEYVDGGTLAIAIGEWRRLPTAERVARAVRALQAVAGALGMFHRFDPPLVHRDLKPQNILMAGGEPRVTDFGIGGVALSLHETTSEAETALAARLPTELRSAGTRVYAPPEQMFGNPPHPRDDVYALGVIAFQMLVGDTAAVPGADAADALRDLGTPIDLTQLVVASVAVDPACRPPDATAWEKALTELPTTERVPLHELRLAVESERPARRWAVPLAAVVALGLTVAFAALIPAFGCRGSSPTTAQAPAPAPVEASKDKPGPTQQATGDNNIQFGNVGGNVTINPDRKPVKIYVLDNAGSAAMVIKEIKNKDNPLFDTVEPENQLGRVPAGTEIELIPGEETPSLNPALHYRKVRILDGELKGKVGWVSAGVIHVREVTR